MLIWGLVIIIKCQPTKNSYIYPPLSLSLKLHHMVFVLCCSGCGSQTVKHDQYVGNVRTGVTCACGDTDVTRKSGTWLLHLSSLFLFVFVSDWRAKTRGVKDPDCVFTAEVRLFFNGVKRSLRGFQQQPEASSGSQLANEWITASKHVPHLPLSVLLISWLLLTGFKSERSDLPTPSEAFSANEPAEAVTAHWSSYPRIIDFTFLINMFIRNLHFSMSLFTTQGVVLVRFSAA